VGNLAAWKEAVWEGTVPACRWKQWRYRDILEVTEIRSCILWNRSVITTPTYQEHTVIIYIGIELRPVAFCVGG